MEANVVARCTTHSHKKPHDEGFNRERACYLKHTTAPLEIAGPINFNMEYYDCAESEAHHIGLDVCDVPYT